MITWFQEDLRLGKAGECLIELKADAYDWLKMHPAGGYEGGRL
jgi:hypothetical protein